MGNQQLVVVDGQEGKQYDELVSGIIFDSPDRFHYLASKGNEIYIEERKDEIIRSWRKHFGTGS